MDDIGAVLGEFIRRIVGTTSKVRPEAALLHDLHIAGDDAAELFDAVHDRFGTSFEGFKFSDYFPDEAEALGAHWFGSVRRSKKKRLTVSHLEAVIRQGRWIEP